MVNVKRPLLRNISIDVNLNDMSSGAIETDIRKERYIVRIAVALDNKFGRDGNHNLFPVGRQNLHLRLELSFSDPMIDDSELQEYRWKSLKEDVLE